MALIESVRGEFPARRAAHDAMRRAGMVLAAALVVLIVPGQGAAQPNPYNSLRLVWTAPGDDGNVGQVSGYDIRYRTTPPAGTDTTSWWNAVPIGQRISLAGNLSSAGNLDSTVIAGLTQGTTYYVMLVAMDEVANRSGYSNMAVGTTQSCGAPSTAPTSFNAVADTGLVQVSWAPTSDPSVVSLHLYRAPATTGTFSLIQSLSPTSGTYVDSNVQPGTTYSYRAAWAGPDAGGAPCEGPSTATISVTTPGTPGGTPGGGTTAASSIHAYPNPSSDGFTVALEVGEGTTQSVRLRLFDMSGHWVATIAEGSYPPGSTDLSWNRIGRNGQRVAPGYYEILGTVGGTRVRERIVLLP